MTISAPFASPKLACHALGNYVEGVFHKMTCWPYNHHEPDTTWWMLVPSPINPSYKCGKVCFDWYDGERRDGLFIGFYCEKGIGDSARPAYDSPKGRRCCMDSTWAWHRFLGDFVNGKLPAIFRSLSASFPGAVEMGVSGGYFPDPADPDPGASYDTWDEYRFSLGASDSNLICEKESLSPSRVTGLEKVSSLDDLRACLARAAKDDYLWINLVIGLRFVISKSPAHRKKDMWEASDIWRNHLSHFQDWLV